MGDVIAFKRKPAPDAGSRMDELAARTIKINELLSALRDLPKLKIPEDTKDDKKNK